MTLSRLCSADRDITNCVYVENDVAYFATILEKVRVEQQRGRWESRILEHGISQFYDSQNSLIA